MEQKDLHFNTFLNTTFSFKMKLYNVHDINTIKFDSDDGDLLVGGSVSGQIVLWDLHNAFEIEEDGEDLIDELNIISDFMVISSDLFLSGFNI